MIATHAQPVNGDFMPTDPQELAQYVRLAQTALEGGSWFWTLGSDQITCTKRAVSLLGLSGATVGRTEFAACFDPADRAFVAQALVDAAQGHGIAIEAVAAGRRLRLVGTVARGESAQPERVLGFVIPVEPRSTSAEINHRLAAIVASSDDAIIGKTIDGIVTSWNQAAERMFGYTAEEMIGQPVSRLAVPARPDEMPAILARLRAGEKIDHFETERRHKDGTILAISLTVSPIHDEDGRIIGASKVARDITAMRQAAAALQEAQDRLRAQQADLLHAGRLSELGQMAAMLAHEVNQPLTAISTYLRACQRLLRSQSLTNQTTLDEAIERALGQAARAGAIIRTVRGLSKRVDADLAAEALDAIVQEAVTLAEIEAHRRSVRVSVGLDPGALTVMADRVQIQQVLLNLMRNATEAMEGQARRELLVTARCVDEWIEVRVADTGHGLPAQVAAALFEPFVTTKSDGVGVGLSICRRIIENHGGRLWAEANPGGGTVFAFTVRRA